MLKHKFYINNKYLGSYTATQIFRMLGDIDPKSEVLVKPLISEKEAKEFVKYYFSKHNG